MERSTGEGTVHLYFTDCGLQEVVSLTTELARRPAQVLQVVFCLPRSEEVLAEVRRELESPPSKLVRVERVIGEVEVEIEKNKVKEIIKMC